MAEVHFNVLGVSNHFPLLHSVHELYSIIVTQPIQTNAISIYKRKLHANYNQSSVQDQVLFHLYAQKKSCHFPSRLPLLSKSFNINQLLPSYGLAKG